MADVSKTVQDHYSQGMIRARVFAWLAENGIDPDDLEYRQLHPIDQLHGRGIEATRQHAEHAAIRPAMHVLDLGCGVGGASRFLAAECGCRVTGIDLTEEYLGVARELTERCGLADRITFRQANATRLPFEDAVFDRVWCHNVTMNIEDKAGLVREVARVLKPGGRFSCAEVGEGPARPPSFPLPWATDPSSSFLVTPGEMCRLIDANGLRVIEQTDLTETVMAFRKAEQDRIARKEPTRRAPHVVTGDDFSQWARNMTANAEAGRIVEHIVVAKKAGGRG